MKQTILFEDKTHKTTEMTIGGALLKNELLLRSLVKFAKNFAIVCDANIEKLLGVQLMSALKDYGMSASLFSFPAGEKSKTRETKEKLEDRLLDNKFGRDACIIAIGGGIATDLGGFLASTYCRGVSLILIPTTLLGMVDAAIGAKNGVNTSHGKNMIGSFYPPCAIIADLDTLKTLSEREMRNGVAEVIKYGMISSPEIFEQMKKNHAKWQIFDRTFLSDVIYKSALEKKFVIESDQRECGLRRTLNFGHTIGHAIEVLEEYAIPHGEAIAIGMIAESYLSTQLNVLDTGSFKEIYDIMKLYGFPLALSKKVTSEKLLSIMQHDKKNENGAIRLCIIESIGKLSSFDGEYCTAVSLDLLKQTLDWMIKEF